MRQDTLAHLNEIVSGLESVTGAIRRDGLEALAAGDHIEIIRHFDQVRIAMDRVKVARQAIEDMKDDFSTNHVPDALMAARVKTLTIEGIGRITVSGRFSVSMLDKDQGHQWLKDNNAGSLIQPTVNASSLSAFGKERIETEGKELPDDIFKVGVKKYTSITKK